MTRMTAKTASTFTLVSASLLAIALGGCGGESKKPEVKHELEKKENVSEKKTRKTEGEIDDDSKMVKKPKDPGAESENDDGDKGSDTTIVDEVPAAVSTHAALPAAIDAIQGTYFSEKFHSASPSVSRLLVIEGTTFRSVVRGLAPGSMVIVAKQVEEGTVELDEAGAPKLVVKRSSCDERPEFVKATARMAHYTKLSAAEGGLAFRFLPLDVERDGFLAKVDAAPAEALEASQIEKGACWYTSGGSLRANTDL